jgi:anaerobic selenocysteine-containing dehydrogenase
MVRGDPEHPVSRGALCRKCALAYNGVFRDSQARLVTPLRRIGPKGEGASSQSRGTPQLPPSLSG